MKSLKRLLDSPAVHRAGVWLIAMYIRFVFATGRKHYHIHPNTVRYLKSEDNAIFAFWHGRMLLMPCISPSTRTMHVLISRHRDGIFISEVMKEFGFKTIAGSTSKKGHSAVMAMLRTLKRGDNVVITPDGPRGPNQVAAAGVASAAKLSGKPVLPFTFSASCHKRARSWDRFMLALPFSRIVFCGGAPIMIDKGMDDEEARLLIERAMNQLTDEADAHAL